MFRSPLKQVDRLVAVVGIVGGIVVEAYTSVGSNFRLFLHTNLSLTPVDSDIVTTAVLVMAGIGSAWTILALIRLFRP